MSRRRRDRDAERVVGLHAVRQVLEDAPERVRELLLQAGRSDQRLQAVIALAETAGLRTQFVAREVLDRAAPGERHQGVLARVKAAPALDESALPPLLEARGRDVFLLILDGVQDPHNLGACLRIADGAGIDAVVAPRDRAAAVNSTVRKVAVGAAETVPFISVTNLARALRLLKDAGVFLVGTSHEGTTALWDSDLTGPLGLVLGGEARGIRRLTAEHCDSLVHLPMAGSVESLNVSVAAGICAFEARRQRRPAAG